MRMDEKMFLERIYITDYRALSACDEELDIIVQGSDGHDYVLKQSLDGHRYWQKYGNDVFSEEDVLHEHMQRTLFSKVQKPRVVPKSSDHHAKKKGAVKVGGYLAFMGKKLKELKASHPHLDSKERMKMVADMWHDLKH